MSTSEKQEFGKIRQMLWPIHNFELKKFIPMFVMFFFVSFNYSLLRIMKDTLVINAPGSGSEIIPYLKLWCTTPAAIFFVGLYIKISTMVTRERLFYITLMPFLAFFTLFPFVLYPAIEYIHPTASADWLQGFLPQGLSGLIAIYRNWTFALFYVLAELWGSVVLSMLYWGFANETTKVCEAKRFYALFLIGANVALLFVAPTANFANSLGDWGKTLQFVNVLALFGIAGICFCYWFVNHVVMKDPRFMVTEKIKKKSKVKLGFADSIKELAKSRYLAYIAFIVLAYGVSINLVEVTWKHNLKVHFGGDKQGFFGFQAMMMSATGLATILFLFFGTNNVLRKFGWRTAALITPIMLLITSLAFFANISFKDVLMGLYANIGMTPLLLVAWIGGAQNVLSKSAKYAFFDPTKEMAYIPLDDQTKRTGKAAIDGVGGRLGKSGGALVNMVLIGIFGSIDAITPYVAVITIGIVGIWLVCVQLLNKEFIKKTSETVEKRHEDKTVETTVETTANDNQSSGGRLVPNRNFDQNQNEEPTGIFVLVRLIQKAVRAIIPTQKA